jgi:tetratricopeptide (TPR) repeat protein
MSRRKAKRNILTQKAKEKDNSAQTKVLSSRRHVLILLTSLFLIIVILAAFEQIRNHAFVNLDDNEYITENRHVQSGLTLEGLTWAFTTTHAANWHPLTWLSHMLDYQLYGLDPSGHHLTNLVFHIASTILLFLVLRRMTGALWRSFFVAALFALHPLHVESVAWVAERKDVLSTLFWVLTMWAYIRYVERPGFYRYLLALLFFALGLMSKPMLVTLPFVLLLLDYWPLGRFQFTPSRINPKSLSSKPKNTNNQIPTALRLIREKTSFFILSAASSILTIFAQQKGGAMASLEHYPFETRIANAVVSYVSYIVKTVWPRHMAVFYPHLETLPTWKVAGAVLLLSFLTFLAIRAVRKHPYLVVGWFWYLGTLVPVIGLVQVGSQAMADRYTYVPLIGLFIIIAWSVTDILAGWRYRRVVLPISAGLLLSLLMIATKLQVKYWRNDVVLFEHSLAVTSNNFIIHDTLGVSLMRQGRLQEAIAHYTEALRIAPDFAKSHYNLGVALERQGRIQEATDRYAEALRIEPNLVEAHNNLGVLLASQGKVQEAATHYTEALRIKTDYADAHYNLGIALAEQGKIQEATVHYTEALRIAPDFAEAHYNLGVVLLSRGKTQEAILHYAEALRIKPDYVKAHNNLGIALTQQGKIQEAVTHFAEAVRLQSDFAEAHINLGLAYLMIGDKVSAVKEYKVLEKLNPDLANKLYQKILK